MIGRAELAVLNPAVIKHANRCLDFDIFAIVIKIVEVNDFFDAGLDNGLGTFDAREEVDVDAGVLELTHVATEIK